MREGVKTGAQASEAEEGSSSPEARVGQTTRRQFLTYGAVGLATAGAAGAGLLRWGNRGATAGAGTAGPRHIDLDITHRIETMNPIPVGRNFDANPVAGPGAAQPGRPGYQPRR